MYAYKHAVFGYALQRRWLQREVAGHATTVGALRLKRLDNAEWSHAAPGSAAVSHHWQCSTWHVGSVLA